MKWKLIPHQAGFTPYLGNAVNYFGLYLNSTGKLAKLVNDREWYDSDICLENISFRVLGQKQIRRGQNHM